MDTYWQELLQEVVLKLVPVVVPLVIAWIGKLCTEIWEKIKEQQPNVSWNMERAAEFAINAAEQLGLSGKLAEFAESKIDYAVQIAEKYLESNGIKNIDLDLVRAAIEAELKKANFPHLSATSEGNSGS